MIKRPLGTLCLIVIGVIFLWTQFFPKQWEDIYFPQGEAYVAGTVYKKDLPKAGKNAVLYITDICYEDAKTQRNTKNVQIICYLHEKSPEAKIGSRIRLRGYPSAFEIATNPGQFDRKFYYGLAGISFSLNKAYVLAESAEYSRFKESLHCIRGFLANKLDECLKEEEAGVLKAILLGTKGTVEEDLKELYARNGIAHILAISGLHISLIGMGIFKSLKRLVPVGIAGAVAAIFMFCYGIMTGFSVSMLRAVLMFLLNMLAKMVGRTYDMLTALGVAALLILLEQPMYLYYGGFVFSFGCVLGIGLLMPVLAEGSTSLSMGKRAILSAGTMAVISYPMYLWFYYQFPLYSMLLNLFVVPLMSFLMAGGLLAITLQIFFPRLVIVPVLLIRGILRIYEISCNICDKLPGHMFTLGKPQSWQVCVYLGILFFLVMITKLSKKRKFSKIKWFAVFVGGIILSLRPGNFLEVTFLDVGQGDCIYVKSRQGNHYLIDGGSTSVTEVGQYRILPFLKYKGAGEVEAVVVTHPDEDHKSGILELLTCGQTQGVRIKSLVLPQIEAKLQSPSYKELENVAQKAGVDVFYIEAGHAMIDEEMYFNCLNPRDGEYYREENEYSVVLELIEKDFRVLLTGDAQGIGEEVLLEEYLQEESNRGITVLKAAHHGSRNSTSEKFLAIIKPRITVISCGKNNSYGHPHKETLERLEQAGSRIFTTAECGAITVKADKKVEVYRFREPKNTAYQ